MIREAATVIVLRPGPKGREVLMVKRNGKTAFFPHTWVFPGGRVDPVDQRVERQGTVAGLDPEWHGHAVAAIRECYEEAGIWLGEGTPPAPQLVAEDPSLMLDSTAVADLGRLTYWSWWLTPEEEPRRYNTLFFAAEVPATAKVVIQASELTQAAWIRPKDALNQLDDGAFFVAPPTFRTLQELVETPVLDNRKPPTHAICPRLRRDPTGFEVILPGHPTYPSDQPVDGPTRIRFHDGQWSSLVE